MIAKTDEKEFTEAVTRTLISEFAPDEMEIFDELFNESYQHPTKPNELKESHNDELAFGEEVLVAALTPATVAMVLAALKYILTEVVASLKEGGMEALKEDGSASIKQVIGSIFKGKDKDEPPALTPEQLRSIKSIARRRAIDFGMDSVMAARMSESLVGALVTKA